MNRLGGIRTVAAAVAAVLLVAGAFVAGYGKGRSSAADGTSPKVNLGVVRDAYREIRSNAVDPPSPDVLAQGAVKGMINALKKDHDHYAAFYSPRAYRSFQELTSGHFSGIGVWLKDRGPRLEVVSVLPSSPARRAGLNRGDVIRTIDGKGVRSLTTDEAVARIKGAAGTRVTLGVQRGDALRRFEITRASLNIPSAIASMTSGDLGYVHVFTFARGAGAQVRKDVSQLVHEGARGVLLDLRDNGGGLFDEGIRVASVFIQNGPIVRYKERSQPEVVYRAKGPAFSNLPVVVLVNGGTASASEIVAGALQDRHRATVVGAQTYGKGSVQQVLPLANSSAMKLTTAAYFTPSGRSINGVGIEPDVRVSRPALQRERAAQILKGIVLSSDSSQG